MATFQETETVVIKGTVKDEDGVLVTPGTSSKITITDPAGTAVKDNQDVTFDSIGIFRYLYTPDSDPVLGAYHVRVIATDSSRLSVTDSQFFLVS